MKKIVAAIVVAVALFVVIPLAMTDKGDYLGPVERGLRTALNGWDMWDGPAVSAHKLPMPALPEGSVSVHGRPNLAKAQATLAALPPEKMADAAALTYRRYCYHCHGKNGDGRVIVGESFGIHLPDLRDPAIQAMSDAELFHVLQHGAGMAIPLADTMSAEETVLAIAYLRTLAGRPSEPYYRPRNTAPLR